MYAAGGGQHGRGSAGERQSNQILPRYDQRCLAIACNPHDAPAAAERSRDIEVAVNVDRQSLRAPESAVEDAHGAVRIDLLNGIEARRCRAGDIQISVIAEGKMIGGDARLQHGEHEDLAVTVDFEDGPHEIAYIQVSDWVEGNSGCDAHAFGVRSHGTVLRHAVYRAVITRGNIETARAVEGHPGGVHHFVQERLHVVIVIDPVDSNRDLLSAGSGERDVNVAVCVDRRIRYRVQVFGDGNADPHLSRIALRSE